jgi:hypothetical protein
VKKLLEGHISFGGIQDALEAVSRLRDVKNGVLQIISQDSSGMIGIFCGRFVTGAVLTLSGDTGNRALRKLLASKEGKFTFLDAGDEPIEDLKQSLGIDINLLLSSGLDPSALPTEDALTGLMVSGDNIKAINTDDIIIPENDEDRRHRVLRTYDRLLSLSQQQALATAKSDDQLAADAGPPTSAGMNELIAQRKVIAEMQQADLVPPPPVGEISTEPGQPTPGLVTNRPPAEKPPIPPWDEPWEPPKEPEAPVQPAEFKRIKNWNEQASIRRGLSLIVSLVVAAAAVVYLWPYISAFLHSK